MNPTTKQIEYVAMRMYEGEGEVYPMPHMPECWHDFVSTFPADFVEVLRERARIAIQAVREIEANNG